MLVTSIILLIASFALPKIWEKVDQAKDAAAITTLRNIESIYEITRAINLVSPESVQASVVRMQAEIHIPQHTQDLFSNYANEIAQQITYAFAGNPPSYEIIETHNGYTIFYWPEPKKDKMLCYELRDDGIHRTQRLQKEHEDVFLEE